MLVSESARPEVLKALSDEYSIRIVLSIVSKSLSVEEISKAMCIPMSTCYRRVHELQSCGIIRIVRTVLQDGKKYHCYKASFKNVSIGFESGELKVDIVSNWDGSDKLERSWDQVRNQDAEELMRITQTFVRSKGVSEKDERV